MDRTRLMDEACRLVSNDKLAEGLYLVTLHAPSIAACIKPGQFVHMQIPGMPDHILRRPFSVFSADAQAGTLSILYQVVGYGSRVLSELEPDAVCKTIGPVGNPWAIPEGARHALLVGGGVGAAPLFMFAEQICGEGLELDVVLGAQTKDALVTLPSYLELAGAQVACATDDGSFGFAGFCTQPAQDVIDRGGVDFVACCGPEPLMRIVSGMAEQAGIPCLVSMERRMACGVGACLSCVVDTTKGKRRACVDGPVFDASEVIW